LKHFAQGRRRKVVSRRSTCSRWPRNGGEIT